MTDSLKRNTRTSLILLKQRAVRCVHKLSHGPWRVACSHPCNDTDTSPPFPFLAWVHRAIVQQQHGRARRTAHRRWARRSSCPLWPSWPRCGVGIGFDVGLRVIVLDPETRSGFGVAWTEDADVDAELKVDTAREAEGAKDGKAIAASDDILVWRHHSLLSDVRRVVVTMMMSKSQTW